VKYELIIVRYGELALKGKQSRKIFENTLIQNIRNAFDKKNISGKIFKEWGRIFVLTSEIDHSSNVLQRIFGVTSISPAVKTSSDLDSISKLSVEISKERLTKNRSFAVRAKRTGEHNYSSQDVAIRVGNEIVKEIGSPVDLNEPDFELFIEVRSENAYLFNEKISCVGGLPLGTQGNICAIIDSHESMLAAWYLMKRGCNVFFVTNKPDNVVLEAFIENWFARSNIFTIELNNNYFSHLNKLVDKNKCLALSVGYSFYYDSKKVIDELKELKKNLEYPILHPLIALNKDEILEKCRKIDLKL
jgi:thiamine biosynthesis protein ThiI